MEANARNVVLVACVVLLNILLFSFLYFQRECPAGNNNVPSSNSSFSSKAYECAFSDSVSSSSKTESVVNSESETSTSQETSMEIGPSSGSLKDRYKRYIPIAMGLDDNVLYPTIVTMTSLIKNKNSNTVYDFYVMHPGYFTNESKKVLSQFMKDNNCSMRLIDMGEDFTQYNPGPGGAVTYYRLKLPMILPEVDRMIWLDSDVLAFGDLTPMYDYNMDGLCFRGYLDPQVDALKYLKVNDDHYICAGILLMNLEEVRKEDYMMSRTFEFMDKHKGNLFQHDQTVINYMFRDKIAALPSKYCMFGCFFFEPTNLRNYQRSLKSNDRYSMEELQQTVAHPVMVHLVHKPYKTKGVGFAKEWWEYADISGYRDIIMEKYGSLRVDSNPIPR